MSRSWRALLSALPFVILAGLFFYAYHSSGFRYAVHMTIMVGLIQLYVPLVDRLLRFFPLKSKNGWTRLGPSSASLLLLMMPLSIALILIVNHVVDFVFFRDSTDFSFLYLFSIYSEQPIFALFVALCMIYGFFTGWIRRLRWNDQEIEYRDPKFRITRIKWADIDHVTLGGAWVSNDVLLKNGKRLTFPKLAGCAGFEQFKAEALAKNVAIMQTGKAAAKLSGA